jgi:hypothetical protein
MKLSFLHNMIVDWSAKKKCTLLELQKLTGYLQFCSQVIPCSCSYLHQLFNFTSMPHSSCCILASAHADICWWAIFSQVWNGVCLITPRKSSGIPVFIDASGWKDLGGVLAHNGFFHVVPNIIQTRIFSSKRFMPC